MPVTPAWLAATSGSPGQAGQVNQFLGTHAVSFLYAGTLQAGVVTSTAATTSTLSTWLAQKFTAGGAQAAVGYVLIPLTTTTASGSSLAPTTVSLCPDSAGAPGAALVSATVTAEYAHLASGGGTTVYVIVPLPSAVTASGTYWITASAAGSGGAFYTWHRSGAASGASTSANGTSWTTQAYGFQYQVFDQGAAGLLTATWEDAGARWRAVTRSGAQVATMAEYTAGQAAAGYLQSFRTLTYSSGLLTGVA